MADHYEREFADHSKNEQTSFQDRAERQKEVGETRIELAKAQQQVRELQLAQEQDSRNYASIREAAERSEELHRQLQHAQRELHGSHETRAKMNEEIELLTARYREDILNTGGRAAELETMLEDRNNEIKLLMYRVQELSSKYVATKGDAIDTVVAKWVNGYRPAVPFFRLSQGHYLFGRRQVICKIVNDKPVFRVGGGFIGFDRFLELYASEELERLLSYDVDERTGQPKFAEAQKACQSLEESGVLEDLRENAEASNPNRGPKSSSRGPRSGSRGRMHSQRVLEETVSARSSRRSFVDF